MINAKMIDFSPAFEFVDFLDIESPQLITKYYPEWYKKIQPKINMKNKHSKLPNGMINSTAKMCMPVFDSISIGYAITLPCDIEFVNPKEYYGKRVLWKTNWQVIDTHTEEQTEGIFGNYDEYEKTPYKFNGLWRAKTPKGYSLLYTHPFYHNDVPFLSATGVVDSDVYATQINIPFYIRKNFTGIVKKNTVISQIIPIKRELWKNSRSGFKKEYSFAFDNINLEFPRSYKNKFWQKKSYN